MLDIIRPTLSIASFEQLGPSGTVLDQLAERDLNIAAVTLDLDKTLVGQHDEGLPPEHMEVVRYLASAGLKIGIISNAQSEKRTERVEDIAKAMGQAAETKVRFVTSMMVGGTRKPKAPVFDLMAKRLGLQTQRDRRRIVHVGDQMLKDVWGANRAGFGASILVAPYGEGDDWRVRLFQRPGEALLRPIVGQPFLTRNFPTR